MTAIRAPEKLVKQPSERRPFDLNVAALLVLPGEEVSQVLDVLKAAQGLVPETDPLVLDGAASYAATSVQQWIKGGTSGEDYLITAKVRTTGGQDLEVEGILQVRDLPLAAAA